MVNNQNRHRIAVSLFNDKEEYKRRLKGSSKKIKVSVEDIERHICVCNPLGLQPNLKNMPLIYTDLFEYLMKFEQGDGGLTPAFPNAYHLELESNIKNSETSFKSNLSFLIGMVLTSLIAEKCFDAIPLEIRHLLKVNPNLFSWSDPTKKLHPDFIAPTLNTRKVLVFDAKGSLINNKGYITSDRVEHGMDQISALNSLIMTHNGSTFTYGGPQLKRFLGTIGNSGGKVRLAAIDPEKSKEESSRYDLTCDLNGIVNYHYQWLLKQAEEPARLETGNETRYGKIVIGEKKLYIPVNFEQYFRRVISGEAKGFLSSQRENVEKFARENDALCSMGSDGIFLLSPKHE